VARAHLARVDLRTEVRLESCDQEREVVLAGERCAGGVVTRGVRRVDERGRVHLLEGVRQDGVGEGQAREEARSDGIVAQRLTYGALAVEGLQVLVEEPNGVRVDAELRQLGRLPLGVLVLQLEVASLDAVPVVGEGESSKTITLNSGGGERLAEGRALHVLADGRVALLGAHEAKACRLGNLLGVAVERVPGRALIRLEEVLGERAPGLVGLRPEAADERGLEDAGVSDALLSIEGRAYGVFLRVVDNGVGHSLLGLSWDLTLVLDRTCSQTREAPCPT